MAKVLEVVVFAQEARSQSSYTRYDSTRSLCYSTEKTQARLFSLFFNEEPTYNIITCLTRHSTKEILRIQNGTVQQIGTLS